MCCSDQLNPPSKAEIRGLQLDVQFAPQPDIRRSTLHGGAAVKRSAGAPAVFFCFGRASAVDRLPQVDLERAAAAFLGGVGESRD